MRPEYQFRHNHPQYHTIRINIQKGNPALGVPDGSVVKNPLANARVQKMPVGSLSREDTLEEEMTTHSSFLAWRIPGTEEPMGYSPWGHKKEDMTERLIMHTCNPAL